MSAIAATALPPAIPRDGAAAARIAAALLGIAALTAAAVALLAAAPVREFLGFGFGGIDPRLSEVVSILANNLRILLALLIACGLAQLALRAAPSITMRTLVVFCDVVVAGLAVAHALLVGAGVGAYGGRMVVALLPHGPLELAAYSLALALYLAARRERLAPRRYVATALAAALGLAIAAPLEVLLRP